MSLYLGNQLISGANTPIQGRVLGQIIQSTIPLSDAGLHLADGSTISGTGSYKDFYEYMLNGNENAIRFRGDLINNNGVISGFANGTCLELNGPTARVDNSEHVVKFTTGSDITTTQAVAHSEYCYCIEISSSNLTTWDAGASTVRTILSSISTNTTYWVKVTISGTTRTFYTSTDGTNYTQQLSFSDSKMNLSANYNYNLGLSSYEYNNPFLGSIDLKASYIKRNNEFIWDGSNYSILPKNFNTQTNYNWSIDNYNVYGKYVLDPTNKTIRLPKITGILEGTNQNDTLGTVVAAGLPNITGSFVSGEWTGQDYTSGAFYQSGTSGSDAGSDNRKVLTLDASRSSSIYGNSSTVQPQTVKVYYYIVIATLTKTEIEVDIDEIATDLNGKADKDLANIDYGAMRTALNSDDIPYITGTYRNGYSWHNIYSDGFVEQGGMLTPSGSAGYKEINLLVEMADTNFCVYTTRGAESTTTNYNVWAQTPNYTNSKTSIKVYVSNVNALVFWRVTGRAKTS